ncbi:ImmA/IrrE family metallo-endopeptidase [Methylorubrum extorquens]|uniref:ImmA/IrrE family metallo-endopeptidase n=1 Tax=Methylorubrum extorquens TaxID=408 RepID=UPI00209E5A50|nr:Zn-dependent peptidase ImmA (M78 family)/predicted secreted protein [Methylorubrum extorquens]
MTRDAVLKGMRAALRLQRDLGIDRGEARGHRVDVFGTIYKENVPLLFRKLEPLMGAYLREDGNPGIILTTRRPLGQQRFTAAHELGHHILNHDPHADDDSILRRSPDLARDYARLPPAEQEADAFASQFLVPNWLIATLMERQRWTPRHFLDPGIVYQMALRAGASYRATLYALTRNRVIGSGVRHQLAKAQPAAIKRALLPDHPLESTQDIDVWHLTERDEGTVIEAGRDDLFLVELREDSNAGYLWSFKELERAGFAILKDGREQVAEGVTGAPTIRRVLARAGDATVHDRYTLWERRPWAPEDDPKRWSFDYLPVHTHDPGLFRPYFGHAVEVH